mgnify:CR=1 FL=1
MIPQQVYDPDRIKTPMKRTNVAKGRGIETRVIEHRAYATRAAEFHEGSSKAEWDNTPIMNRILELREEDAKMLGFEDPVLFRTAGFVLDAMAEAYPEEAKRKEFVAKVVKNEEERFIQTLGNGLRILSEEIAKLKMKDLNAADIEGAMAMVEGSARSMGLQVTE